MCHSIWLVNSDNWNQGFLTLIGQRVQTSIFRHRATANYILSNVACRIRTNIFFISKIESPPEICLGVLAQIWSIKPHHYSYGELVKINSISLHSRRLFGGFWAVGLARVKKQRVRRRFYLRFRERKSRQRVKFTQLAVRSKPRPGHKPFGLNRACRHCHFPPCQSQKIK